MFLDPHNWIMVHDGFRVCVSSKISIYISCVVFPVTFLFTFATRQHAAADLSVKDRCDLE